MSFQIDSNDLNLKTEGVVRDNYIMVFYMSSVWQQFSIHQEVISSSVHIMYIRMKWVSSFLWVKNPPAIKKIGIF